MNQILCRTDEQILQQGGGKTGALKIQYQGMKGLSVEAFLRLQCAGVHSLARSFIQLLLQLCGQGGEAGEDSVAHLAQQPLQRRQL